MRNSLKALYARTRNLWTGSDREKGASALEYVGIIIVAALVVGAIFTVLNDADVEGTVQDNVDEILND